MELKGVPPSWVKGRFVDTIEFTGHPLVSALHPTTIEVTKDSRLTKRGDCVIGVSANKSVADLAPGVRHALKTDGSQVAIRIGVSGQAFALRASGDPRLTFSHPTEIVLRRSNFISDRTLAVSATAAARDIPRTMVSLLKRGYRGTMEVEVRVQ